MKIRRTWDILGMLFCILDCPIQSEWCLRKVPDPRRLFHEMPVQTILNDMVQQADTRRRRRCLQHSARIFVEYPDGVAQAQIARWVTIAEQAVQLISGLFQLQKAPVLRLCLVDEGVWARPHYSAYIRWSFCAGAKVVMKYDESMPPRRILTILSHEYTHIMTHKLTKGWCPHWLDEGIARYAEAACQLRPPAVAPSPDLISLTTLSQTYKAYIYSLVDSNDSARRQYYETLNATQFVVSAFIDSYGTELLLRSLRSRGTFDQDSIFMRRLLDAARQKALDITNSSPNTFQTR